MTILIGVIGALVYYDPAYRLLRMYGRRASIQVSTSHMYAIEKAKFKKNFLYTVCNTTMPGTLKLISMAEKLYFLHRSVVWYMMMIVTISHNQWKWQLLTRVGNCGREISFHDNALRSSMGHKKNLMDNGITSETSHDFV